MPPITPAQNNTINEKNAIATSVLENPTKTPNLPVTQPVNIPDVSSFIATPQQDKQTQDNIDNLTAQSGSVFNELFGTMQKKETRGAQQTQMEQQAGIPQLTEDLADIQNQITNSNLQFRRAQEDLYKNPSLRGVPMSVIRSKESEIARVAASNLADLEVVRAARSNSLNAIQSIIDRKVQRQFADDEARINNLKFVYENVKGDLTKAQDRQYQEKITKESRAFELAKDKYQQVENVKAELVKNAHMNGAGNGVLQAVMAAKTLDEAYRAAGNYGLSIDDKIKRSQLAKLVSETGIPEQEAQKAVIVADTISNIDKLIANKGGFEAAVGPTSIFGRRGLFRPGKKSEFVAGVEQLTGELTLNNLINAKARGATFGALSEGELKILASSASKIGTYAIKDKSGNIKGYKTTEKGFQRELDNIKNAAIKDFELKTGKKYSDYQKEQDISVDSSGNIVIPGEVTNEEFFK